MSSAKEVEKVSSILQSSLSACCWLQVLLGDALGIFSIKVFARTY